MVKAAAYELQGSIVHDTVKYDLDPEIFTPNTNMSICVIWRKPFEKLVP